MEIKWTDLDPNTGKKRFVRASRFAGKWEFACRRERRSDWEIWRHPSREMWEVLLENLERRLPRKEGTELDDVKKIRSIIENYKEFPTSL